LAETGGEQGGSGRVELLDSNSTVELVGSELAQLLSSNLVELELLGFSLIELVSSDLVEVVWWFDPWFEFVGRFDPWFQFAKWFDPWFGVVRWFDPGFQFVVWFDPWFEVVRWFDSGFQFVVWFDPGSGPEVFSELTSLVLVAVQAETPPEYSNPILSGQPLLPWTWSPSSWIGKPTTAAADGHNSV